MSGDAGEEDIRAFREGVDIGEERPAGSARLVILCTQARAEGTVSQVQVTVQEGRYHQVKRMFAAVGRKVLYLKRISMGSLSLDESLPKGGYRPLTEEELQRLREN